MREQKAMWRLGSVVQPVSFNGNEEGVKLVSSLICTMEHGDTVVVKVGNGVVGKWSTGSF